MDLPGFMLSGIGMKKMNKGIIMLAAAISLASCAAHGDVDLVPTKPASAPSYYCTWAVQNYMYGQGLPTMDAEQLEGGTGAQHARDAFTEHNMLGEKGWAKTFYPKVRGDLYFLVDDGYYDNGMASMELDTQKFPSFAGSPTQRLQLLNQAVIKEGWRGLALWSRGTPNDPALIQRSKDANVHYWKIDGGDGDFALQTVKQSLYPGLLLEHVRGEGPFNGNWAQDGRFGPQDWNSDRLAIIKHTDVYRTYDVSTFLSIPTTLDRVEELLKGAQGHPEVTALLNCEDEATIAATLGCTMGIMRHPLVGLRPSGDPDVFFNGGRQVKRRMDEVVRALHWQRIAEPYAAGSGYVNRDESDVLTDDWVFERGETWDSSVIGKDVKQGAAARFSRNLPLPIVTTNGEAPYVIAGKFPNGAVAVCTLGRVTKDKDWHSPLAGVTLDTGGSLGPFGIFGHYQSLTLTIGKMPNHPRIVAQDLAGEKATDITKRVAVHNAAITLPGKLIDQIGLSSGTKGDLSDPGMVIEITGH
jgi:hypothetical protein